MGWYTKKHIGVDWVFPISSSYQINLVRYGELTVKYVRTDVTLSEHLQPQAYKNKRWYHLTVGVGKNLFAAAFWFEGCRKFMATVND